MYDTFQVAAGTIAGRRHVGSGNLLVGNNNQDAYGMASDDRCLVAAVFDGCSSTKHAEVGAKVAAQVVPHVVLAATQNAGCDEDHLSTPAFWNEVKQTLLSRFAALAGDLKPDDADVIVDYFLFTILGVILTNRNAVLFSMGDGIYAIDNVVHRIGPFAENAPPYLCYELLRNQQQQEQQEQQFAINVIPASDFHSILIGTDGAIDLVAHHPVPTILSKESITLWLRKLNSEVVTLGEVDGMPALKRSYGLLADDTTLIAITRKRGEQAC